MTTADQLAIVNRVLQAPDEAHTIAQVHNKPIFQNQSAENRHRALRIHQTQHSLLVFIGVTILNLRYVSAG